MTEKQKMDKRHAALWEAARAAGVADAERVVPKPLWLTGTVEPYPEGEFGTAWLVLDRREPFARWALACEIGEPLSRSQVRIGCSYRRLPEPDYSFSRSLAYAEAVRSTLVDGGVAVLEIQSHQD